MAPVEFRVLLTTVKVRQVYLLPSSCEEKGCEDENEDDEDDGQDDARDDADSFLQHPTALKVDGQ